MQLGPRTPRRPWLEDMGIWRRGLHEKEEEKVTMARSPSRCPSLTISEPATLDRRLGLARVTIKMKYSPLHDQHSSHLSYQSVHHAYCAAWEGILHQKFMFLSWATSSLLRCVAVRERFRHFTSQTHVSVGRCIPHKS